VSMASEFHSLTETTQSGSSTLHQPAPSPLALSTKMLQKGDMLPLKWGQICSPPDLDLETQRVAVQRVNEVIRCLQRERGWSYTQASGNASQDRHLVRGRPWSVHAHELKQIRTSLDEVLLACFGEIPECITQARREVDDYELGGVDVFESYSKLLGTVIEEHAKALNSKEAFIMIELIEQQGRIRAGGAVLLAANCIYERAGAVRMLRPVMDKILSLESLMAEHTKMIYDRICNSESDFIQGKMVIASAIRAQAEDLEYDLATTGLHVGSWLHTSTQVIDGLYQLLATLQGNHHTGVVLSGSESPETSQANVPLNDVANIGHDKITTSQSDASLRAARGSTREARWPPKDGTNAIQVVGTSSAHPNAVGNGLENTKDDNCALCRDTLKIPVTLACQHQVCFDCVRNFVRPSEQAGLAVYCMLCKRHVHVSSFVAKDEATKTTSSADKNVLLSSMKKDADESLHLQAPDLRTKKSQQVPSTKSAQVPHVQEAKSKDHNVSKKSQVEFTIKDQDGLVWTCELMANTGKPPELKVAAGSPIIPTVPPMPVATAIPTPANVMANVVPQSDSVLSRVDELLFPADTPMVQFVEPTKTGRRRRMIPNRELDQRLGLVEPKQSELETSSVRVPECIRNRQAARNYRIRDRQYVVQLEQVVQALEQRKADLTLLHSKLVEYKSDLDQSATKPAPLSQAYHPILANDHSEPMKTVPAIVPKDTESRVSPQLKKFRQNNPSLNLLLENSCDTAPPPAKKRRGVVDPHNPHPMILDHFEEDFYQWVSCGAGEEMFLSQ